MAYGSWVAVVDGLVKYEPTILSMIELSTTAMVANPVRGKENIILGVLGKVLRELEMAISIRQHHASMNE